MGITENNTGQDFTRNPSRLNSYLPIASPYTTPTLSAGVPTKLLIPTTPKSIKDFTLDVGNSRWFLDDPTAANRLFIVHLTTSIITSITNHDVAIELYKNGAFEEGVSIERFIAAGTDKGSLALNGIVSLSDNDYIEVYVTNSATGIGSG